MARFKRGKLIETVKTQVLDNHKSLMILDDEEIQSLDPNGIDRNIMLPNESNATGFNFKIFNVGTVGDLIIKDSGGSNIITTLKPNTMGLFSCNGTVWNGTSGSGADLPETSNGYGTRYVSASVPSGGEDGDIWLQYV